MQQTRFIQAITRRAAEMTTGRLSLLVLGGLCIAAVLFSVENLPGQQVKAVKTEKSRGNESTARESRILLQDCRITPVQIATLSTDRYGVLADVAVREGTNVEADQVIARLQDDVAMARYVLADERAKDDIDVRYAAKASDYARKEYEIALDSRERVKGSVPELELEKLKLALERGELQIEKAEHDFLLNKLSREEMLADLNSYRIKTPFSGIVTRVYKHKGEAVRQGDPVLELINTDKLRVEGYLSIRDRFQVKVGAAVAVKLDLPDEDLEIENEIFEGQVTFVDVSVVPASSLFRVWAEVPNRDDLLRVGLTAQMIIYPDRIMPLDDEQQAKSIDSLDALDRGKTK